MLNWDLRFFKDILMYVAQTSFRFLNMPFIVGVSLDIIYYWFLGCFIGFNCKYSKNIVRHVLFIMANLKVILAYYNVGDNVVNGIYRVSGYRVGIFDKDITL